MSEVTIPTKTLSWEEFYKKTDNGNKLMGRVWYCVASTEKDIGDQAVFWEHWYWNEGEAEKDLDMKKAKDGSNHTLTVDKEGKEVDYPLWPVAFNKESFKMYPAIDCKCMVIAPIAVSLLPVAFPTDDSKSEFRVDFANAMGKKMYFIFSLTPHMSETEKTREFQKLEAECGVKREWFHEVKWDPKYKIGSSGDPDINPK
jgi:hypothetical protein